MVSSKSGWKIYLPLIIISNSLLWAFSIFFLATASRTYTSNWSATLPDFEESTRISLPQIGGATSQQNSPFDNNRADPRETYKFIATSNSVISEAADRLGLKNSEFGKPRVEIVDNTTLMQFSIEGDSPESAYEKAVAFSDAFANKLSMLRESESQERTASLERALQESEIELEKARTSLSNFKVDSGLVAYEQLNELSANLENLRIERATVLAQLRASDARLSQLSNNLNVSTSQISDAFLLASDEVFRQNLLDYGEATRNVESLREQLGANHPTMARETARQSATRSALLARGRDLLGRPVNERDLAQLSLSIGGNSAREQLFRDTFLANGESEGLAAQTSEISQQISQLDNRRSHFFILFNSSKYLKNRRFWLLSTSASCERAKSA